MRRKGFTLIEMLLCMGLVTVVGAGLYLFSSTSSRFIARNLATNHSHEGTRISSFTFLNELSDSASAFQLISANNNTFTEVVAATSAELDSLTEQNIGTRTNGVTFRRLLAGPIPLKANTTADSTTLSFDFSSLGGDDLPTAGDKLRLPLISREFLISAASSNGTVTIPGKLGFTLKTESPNLVTGYFYRRAAFTVQNRELRYHSNFNSASRTIYRVVRTGITTPTPFSILFPSSTSLSANGLNLRVSMELTDLEYSARNFGSGTTTLHTIYTPRSQPTPLSTLD